MPAFEKDVMIKTKKKNLKIELLTLSCYWREFRDRIFVLKRLVSPAPDPVILIVTPKRSDTGCRV